MKPASYPKATRPPTAPSSSLVNYVPIGGWEHFSWLRAAFSTRGSGATLVYRQGAEGSGEQNLGWTREDDPLHVGQNRRRFLSQITGDPAFPLITIKQIHSGIVTEVTPPDEATGMVSLAPYSPSGHSTPVVRMADGTIPEGDGLICTAPGLLMGILTADCVPVLVADTRTRVVAAFHAGWRGTLARIVETGVAALRARHGSRPEDLIAAIGPAIRPCCFEVGLEVEAAFAEAFVYAKDLFSSAEPLNEEARPRLDLQEANRRQLLDAGLDSDQIQIEAECTACCRTLEGRRKYFSYRAEGGVTGRMLSVIGTLQTDCPDSAGVQGGLP